MKKATQEQILSAVEERRDSVIAFLQSIVQIDSETGREAEIQAFISKKLTQMGLEVDEFEPDLETLKNHPGYVQPDIPYKGRPNVVGTFRGEGGGRSLLFNGHVDTVPTAPDDQWTDGPLSGSLRDGALWGRGASDMKGGLAAMTMALDVLLQIGRKPKGDVILEYVVDEERTGMGTLACVLKGYKADAGICCETSDLEVMPACIGRLWFRIDLRGKPSGIASRWESVSAIEKGILIVKAVDDLEKMRIDDLRHPLYPDNRGALPCAVTMFNSGTFPSVTPEDAVLKGSMGLMPYEDLEDAKQQLVDQVNLVSQADPWLRKNPPVVSFDEGLAAAGAEIPNDHPIVESVVAAFEAARGEPPVLGARKGAADTRFLIRYGETPTVIFGPGITAEMHAMNEHVPVENLISSTKVLALTIDDWCQ